MSVEITLKLVSHTKAVAYEKCQGAHKAKNREVRSPTCEVLSAAANNLGAQRIFLGASGFQARVQQQPYIPSASSMNSKTLII